MVFLLMAGCAGCMGYLFLKDIFRPDMRQTEKIMSAGMCLGLMALIMISLICSFVFGFSNWK